MTITDKGLNAWHRKLVRKVGRKKADKAIEMMLEYLAWHEQMHKTLDRQGGERASLALDEYGDDPHSKYQLRRKIERMVGATKD